MVSLDGNKIWVKHAEETPSFFNFLWTTLNTFEIIWSTLSLCALSLFECLTFGNILNYYIKVIKICKKKKKKRKRNQQGSWWCSPSHVPWCACPVVRPRWWWRQSLTYLSSLTFMSGNACPHSSAESGGLKLASYYFTYLTQFIHYSSMTLHWAWGHEYVEAGWVRVGRKGERKELKEILGEWKTEKKTLLSSPTVIISLTLAEWLTLSVVKFACVIRAYTSEHRYITFHFLNINRNLCAACVLVTLP